MLEISVRILYNNNIFVKEETEFETVIPLVRQR